MSDRIETPAVATLVAIGSIPHRRAAVVPAAFGDDEVARRRPRTVLTRGSP